MINWIHFTIEAPLQALKGVWSTLKDEPACLQIILNEQEPVLFIESFDANMILDEIRQASKQHQEETFKLHYCASIPGFYHRIDGTVRAGEISIAADEYDRIL